MNLTGVTYWSTSEPFIDRFKTSGPWKANGGGGAVTTDAHGNPLGVPAGAANISTNFAVDPLSAGTVNQYVMTYDGTATIRVIGAQIVGSEAGKIVFEVTRPTASLALSVSGIDTADPLHDVHIVRADQVGLFEAGEIFNPAFLDKVSQWDVLRFMGWQNTNTLSPVSWDSHSSIDNATWNTGVAPDGVPIEVMVRLANEAHTDMWYNIPTTADDNYATNALAYIRDNLDPSLKVHVEYSNEVWNWSFDAATYAQNQANALWGTDANRDGVIDASDKAENVQGGWEVYYGYRSAQMAQIAHDVFGDEAAARLDTVLAAQATYPALTTAYVIPGIAKAGLGAVGDLFSEYAIAPYFGNNLSRPATDADRATVLAWARSGEDGIEAAFHELEFGGSLSTDLSLAKLAQNYVQQSAIASQNGLDLVTYEGGAHLTSTAYAAGPDRDDVNAFFGKLLNDPRTGELYTEMLADFAQAGGSLFTAMNETGSNATSGYWGVLDTIYDTSSPRYDALVEAQDDGRNAPHLPATDPESLDPTPIISKGTDGDNALIGHAGADRLFGGDGDDVLSGGAGDDILGGGAGLNILTGGTGADTFIFSLIGDLPKEGHDMITDFSHAQGDRIDLSAIDANTSVGGDQAFTFIGNGAFTHHPGELAARYDAVHNQMMVQIDVNGDGVADHQILLAGLANLSASDFIL